jgi:hypothetical protein
MSPDLPVPVLAGEVLDPPAPSALPIPAQADTDRNLIAMWVACSESPHTRRNYAHQAARFLAEARTGRDISKALGALPEPV